MLYAIAYALTGEIHSIIDDGTYETCAIVLEAINMLTQGDSGLMCVLTQGV